MALKIRDDVKRYCHPAFYSLSPFSSILYPPDLCSKSVFTSMSLGNNKLNTTESSGLSSRSQKSRSEIGDGRCNTIDLYFDSAPKDPCSGFAVNVERNVTTIFCPPQVQVLYLNPHDTSLLLVPLALALTCYMSSDRWHADIFSRPSLYYSIIITIIIIIHKMRTESYFSASTDDKSLAPSSLKNSSIINIFGRIKLLITYLTLHIEYLYFFFLL